MIKKHKKCGRVLNYTDHLLIVISIITGCVSIPVFAFSAGVPIEIISSAVGLEICLTTEGIKTYKSIIKKNKKKGDKIILLANFKL